MIVNGQRNKVILDIANKEKTDYTVYAVTGQVSKANDFTQVVRNVSVFSLYKRERVNANSKAKFALLYLVDCYSLW